MSNKPYHLFISYGLDEDGENYLNSFATLGEAKAAYHDDYAAKIMYDGGDGLKAIAICIDKRWRFAPLLEWKEANEGRVFKLDDRIYKIQRGDVYKWDGVSSMPVLQGWWCYEVIDTTNGYVDRSEVYFDAWVDAANYLEQHVSSLSNHIKANNLAHSY